MKDARTIAVKGKAADGDKPATPDKVVFAKIAIKQEAVIALLTVVESVISAYFTEIFEFTRESKRKRVNLDMIVGHHEKVKSGSASTPLHAYIREFFVMWYAKMGNNGPIKRPMPIDNFPRVVEEFTTPDGVINNITQRKKATAPVRTTAEAREKFASRTLRQYVAMKNIFHSIKNKSFKDITVKSELHAYGSDLANRLVLDLLDVIGINLAKDGRKTVTSAEVIRSFMNMFKCLISRVERDNIAEEAAHAAHEFDRIRDELDVKRAGVRVQSYPTKLAEAANEKDREAITRKMDRDNQTIAKHDAAKLEVAAKKLEAAAKKVRKPAAPRRPAAPAGNTPKSTTVITMTPIPATPAAAPAAATDFDDDDVQAPQ
jgi:hypothetical protein